MMIRLRAPIALALFMMGAEALDWTLGFYSFDRWGILPWSWSHIPGVVLMPLLHDGFAHLFANLGPLLVLGGVLAMRGIFWPVTIAGTLATGTLVWLLLLGAQAVHVGASGLVLCYFGFLLVRGMRTRAPLDLAVTFGAAFFYGLAMWATLTNFAPGVSWQGHVFGFVAGAGLAWFEPRWRVTP